ncbi:hypothetical protein DFH08DRAFT_965516 [Mycena albidolilacea]|uniref:Uncharacterized protein n=1 Tax=Mycena albidolilacea TaxID=1033008 RepID=A0AAD6ZQU3_9AGAR|nr:hypothetical protein DFH08DRAFT_965516 [Mycena albidolilacea]
MASKKDVKSRTWSLYTPNSTSIPPSIPLSGQLPAPPSGAADTWERPLSPSSPILTPKLHVTRSMVVKAITMLDSTKAAAIPLPWTKSTHERGGLLTITARDNELCPLKAFNNHHLVNAVVLADALLFAFQALDGTWPPLTKTWFMKRCMQIWDAASILHAFGHSFRIGSSTELLLAGIEHIVPMHVGKAYDKAKLNEVAKAFEAFRVAHNIIMPSIEDLRLLDED